MSDGQRLEDHMPAYRTLGGDADLPLPPPFHSLGLTMSYYPLVGDMARMRRLCDEYLNFAGPDGKPTLPEAVGRFEPILPYVLLITADHPHVEVGDQGYGWFQQREITFGFFVAWYRKRRRGWVLEGTPFFNAYIYLDSSLGFQTGREVDGWPKQMARFEGWGRGLSAGGPPLRATTLVTNGAAPLEPRVLFEIQRVAPARDPYAGLLAAQSALFHAWASILRAPSAVARPLLEASLNPASWWHQWRQLLFAWRDSGIIKLKQFRDVASPSEVAYQALVSSTMQLDRLGQMAPLGCEAQWMGDLSGGYRIHMHEYESQPVIDRLGLQVEHDTMRGGVRVATLRPLAPFSVGLDITYPRGTVLASRTIDSPWQIDGTAAAPARLPNLYNETLQPTVPCLRGPFRLPDAKIRVLPLEADPDALAALCKGYYADTQPIVPVGNRVYLVITVGEQEQLGGGPRWAIQQVGFYLPVVRGGEYSLVNPFLFTSNDRSQATARELHGSNAALSSFTGPWAAHDEPSRPLPPGSLLALRTEGFPVIGRNLQARSATLIEIVTTAAGQGPTPAPLPAVLASVPPGDLPFTVIDLKQYRDTTEPQLAAYQAMVRRNYALHLVDERVSVPESLAVRIHDDATHPVARILGLGRADRDGTVEVQPISPFYFTAEIQIANGETLP
jgi:hypothetical protein